MNCAQPEFVDIKMDVEETKVASSVDDVCDTLEVKIEEVESAEHPG